MKNTKSTVTPKQSKKVALGLGLAVIVFLLGTFFGTTLSKDPEKVIEKVEVEKNATAWEELKKIDDQAIRVAIKNSELSSAGFYAISQGDKGTIQAVAEEAKKNKQEFDKLTDERKEVLKKLGY